MRSEDIADEKETEDLALWFGGEEGSEELLSSFGGDTATVVSNGKGGPPFVPREGHGTLDSNRQKYRSPLGGSMGGRCYTFNGILHYIDEYLLEKSGIEANGSGFIGEVEVQMDLRAIAEAFEEGTAGLHLLAEVTELQVWFRYLDDAGKTGDEVGHG